MLAGCCLVSSGPTPQPLRSGSRRRTGRHWSDWSSRCQPKVFAATDSLGWVYQFWQSEKKNEVNRSEVKIGADELPAVTQLFTEPYMVSFLLDNGLGAWWAARRLSDSDLKETGSEAELRRKASIPGVPLDYLRFGAAPKTPQKRPGGASSPGNFDGWPEHLGELKILDPCCGSGHFLVAAFSMLVPMRMAREHLTARAAVDAVLQENLHGLELDPRCVELAAFALALAAWTYPGAGRISATAGTEPRLLGSGAQRDEGTVARVGGAGRERLAECQRSEHLFAPRFTALACRSATASKHSTTCSLRRRHSVHSSSRVR